MGRKGKGRGETGGEERVNDGKKKGKEMKMEEMGRKRKSKKGRRE